MLVYLCGPINGCTDDEAMTWRERVKQLIGAEQCIDPMRNDYRGKEDSCFREIVETDKSDILRADVLFVNYVKPSVGTSMEVLFAWWHSKPVIVICTRSAPISPWLRYHATEFVHSIPTAVSMVKRMDK